MNYEQARKILNRKFETTEFFNNPLLEKAELEKVLKFATPSAKPMIEDLLTNHFDQGALFTENLLVDAVYHGLFTKHNIIAFAKASLKADEATELYAEAEPVEPVEPMRELAGQILEAVRTTPNHCHKTIKKALFFSLNNQDFHPIIKKRLYKLIDDIEEIAAVTIQNLREIINIISSEIETVGQGVYLQEYQFNFVRFTSGYLIIDVYNVNKTFFFCESAIDSDDWVFLTVKPVDNAQQTAAPVMEVYFLEETTGAGIHRHKFKIEAKNLRHAKIRCTDEQCFFGTWLHLYDKDKNHIARKNPHSGKWETTPQSDQY